MYYSGWYVPFPVQLRHDRGRERRGAARADGSGLREITAVSVAEIAAGRYDGYLSAYAEAVRAYRHPVILSFGHEMNGWWSSWGYTHTSPATFVAAWRHIVTLFRDLGARNVTWLWTVNIINDTPGGKIPPPAPWWPGNSYVTWVGIDGYYLKPSWQFAPLFGPTIAAVRALTSDPILIAETGATVCCRPASEDRRRVRWHSRVRAARVRVVRLHEHHRPGLQHQQPCGSRRVPQGRQYLHQAWVMKARCVDGAGHRVPRHHWGTVAPVKTDRARRHRRASPRASSGPGSADTARGWPRRSSP